VFFLRHSTWRSGEKSLLLPFMAMSGLTFWTLYGTAMRALFFGAGQFQDFFQGRTSVNATGVCRTVRISWFEKPVSSCSHLQ
jgi:hypothetical protein